MQTKEKFYFICNKWFALDKKDGRIDHLFTVATQSDLHKLSYLMSKNTKDKLKEDHLWLSIFTKPVSSSFSRLDRTTCVFVLLCISMLVNILYYDLDTTSINSGLEFGPFKLTPQLVCLFVKSIENLLIKNFIIISILDKCWHNK